MTSKYEVTGLSKKVLIALATSEEAVQDVSGKGLIFPLQTSLYKMVLVQTLLIKMPGQQYSEYKKIDSDLIYV